MSKTEDTPALVNRLRAFVAFEGGDLADVEAAADEIERLRAECERLIADGWRQCAKGQKTTQYCGQLEAAVAAERERWAADARLAAYVRERADERADGWRIDVWIIGAPSLETIDDVLRA